MTLTATYASDLSRVRLAIASAPAAADYALIERSLDQITWTTVRGGDTVPLTLGAAQVDDYEFAPGQQNYYRASYVDSGPITYVGVGTPATGVNASVLPDDPAGVLTGDLLLVLASIRNSGVGTVNAPAGWTKVIDAGNVAILGKRAAADGEGIPQITFSGGVASADTMAQGIAVRNAELIPASFNTQLNASAQNVAYPALTVPGPKHLIVLAGWKQDDWTSASSPVTEISEVVSTAGDDAAMTWGYLVETTAINVAPFMFTITGGATAISRGITAAFRPADYITRETTSITPTINQVWIKAPTAPYLNTALSEPVGLLSIVRKARVGLYDVVGRDVQISVTDRRAGKAYTLGALVEDPVEKERIDLILDFGQVVLFQFPPGIRLDDMYVSIGDSTYDDESSTYTLPVTQVAAPTSTVYPATVTWQNVVSTYPTWADLIAAKSTWADVLDIVGSPTDIITG
jgi:hypothetical protein